MRKRTLRLLALSFPLLFASMPVPAFAASGDKATPKAESAEAPSYLNDERLKIPVTLHDVGVPLSVIVSQLGSATGVIVRASKTIEDKRFTVLLDKIPALTVLQALATAFQFKIQAKGQPESLEYAIVQPRTRQEEAARTERQDVFRKRMEALKRSALAASDPNVKLDDENQALLNTSFAFFSVGGMESRKLVFFLDGLTEDEENALYQGIPVSRSFFQYPERERKFLAASLENLLDDRLDPCSDTSDKEPDCVYSYPALGDDILQRATVTLWVDPDLNASDRVMNVRVQNIDLSNPIRQGALLPTMKPKLKLDFSFGGRGPEVNMSFIPDDRIKEAKRKRLAIENPNTEWKKPLKSLDFDDYNQSAIESGVEWELHRATNLPLLSDYYIRKDNSFLDLRYETIGDALDFFSAAFNSDFLPVGPIQTFRSRSGSLDDKLEPSTATLERWRSIGTKEKSFSLDELSEIAQLSVSQISRLDSTRIMPGISGLAKDPDALNSLRLFGRLTAEQKAALFSPAGLPFAHLSPDPLSALAMSDRIEVFDGGGVRAETGAEGATTFRYAASDGGTLDVRIPFFSLSPAKAKDDDSLPDGAFDWRAEKHPKPREKEKEKSEGKEPIPGG